MFRKMLKPLVMLVALSMIFASLTACTTAPVATSAPASSVAASAAATSAAASSAAATEAATPAPEASKAPEAITLEFIAPSPVTSVNGFDAVLAEFVKQTAATLNVKINYTFTGFDNIGQKVSLKLSAGEPVDCCFTAQWTNPNIMQMVSKGMLTNLDKYFTDTTNYAGLNKAFTQDFLRNNSFADAKNEYHVYGIPFGHSFSGGSVIYYRKDLATKYGIADIKTYDDLIKYFEAIKTNEKGMVPYSQLGSNDVIADTLQSLVNPVVVGKHNTVIINNVGIAIKDDGSIYASKSIVPSLDPEYHAMEPAPNNTLDPLQGYKMARDWYVKGYLEKDILNQKDHEGQFMAGKAASYARGLDTYSMINNRLKSSIPGAQLGYWVVQSGIRYGMDKVEGSDFKVWNFASLPVTSKNNDRVMQFFNWLYTSMDNHDLFELGIKDKDWVAVGSDKYKLPDGVAPEAAYNFPGYILTWNPTMQRYDANTPDEVVNIMKKLGDTSYYYKSPIAGFSFVTDPVKTETAKLGDLASLRRAVGNGVIADVAGEIAKIQKQYDQAGFQKVRDEVIKQFSAFLKDNPYQGQ